MAKMKVHELAKELKIESKQVIAFLQEKGVEVKAQSAIEDNVIEQVRKAFGGKGDTQLADNKTTTEELSQQVVNLYSQNVNYNITNCS